MYNNPYMQNYNQQSFNEQIDNEIAKLQRMKSHNISQPAINQTFQISPTNNGIKFVNCIEDVQKELSVCETPFINKDYSILWIKNAKGEIRSFELEEIVPKDEKDLIIESLKKEITKLKEMKNNEHYYVKSNDEKWDEYESKQFIESIKNEKSTNVSNNRTSKSKAE